MNMQELYDQSQHEISQRLNMTPAPKVSKPNFGQPGFNVPQSAGMKRPAKNLHVNDNESSYSANSRGGMKNKGMPMLEDDRP